MNPHQKNKIDISSLSEEEQKLFRLYGKLPNRKDLLQNKLKERKYFDSGDYAMSKAGKADTSLVGGLGREHPSPETIPHLTSQASNPNANPAVNSPGLTPTISHIGASGSPQKESLLQRGMSIDDTEDNVQEGSASADGSASAVTEPQGIPIKK